MYNADYLIRTSISDARMILEHQLTTNPNNAHQLAKSVVDALQDNTGHKTRRQMANAIANRAAKLINAPEHQKGVNCEQR